MALAEADSVNAVTGLHWVHITMQANTGKTVRACGLVQAAIMQSNCIVVACACEKIEIDISD